MCIVEHLHIHCYACVERSPFSVPYVQGLHNVILMINFKEYLLTFVMYL